MAYIAEWIGIFIGIVSGISGLVLGIMNYLRDNSRVSVSLQWDMEPFGNLPLEKGKLYGAVRISDVGRRPIFISHVSIRLPNGEELLITDSIVGERLSEGDAPKIYPVKQAGLEEFREYWDKIYAVVRDSADKEYKSKHQKNKPSWAELPFK